MRSRNPAITTASDARKQMTEGETEFVERLDLVLAD